jgi:type IV pilus assembly protein PilY1
MRAKLRNALLAGLALAFLPLATDGGQGECCNLATSLTSTVVGPVNGDETFFKLPTGPANVMMLLDVSGSMDDLPQCANGWGSSPCGYPTFSGPTNSTNRAVTFTYTGTCSTGGWMDAITLSTTYADPGRSNTLLTDSAPWGNGCTGNACLFDPGAVYVYGSWNAGSTAASTYATRSAHDTSASLPATCTALDSGGNVIRDYNNNPIVLGSDCVTCLQNKGYFFFKLSKYYSLNSSNVPNAWRNYTPSGSQYRSGSMFKGTFLNANPPKWVSARKVVKDIAWMDPNAPSKLDKVRLGLAILDSDGTSPRKARLIVPLGPDRTGAYPPTQASFRQARQYLLSVLNYDATVYSDGATTIVDGSTLTGFFNPATTWTPLGSALLNVGQYFTSTNRYNTLLGSGYQTAVFNESASGECNAAWARGNPNQCSICWACQNNSVVVVTDGMPNSEIPFPAAITGYDNTGYNNAGNCGGTVTCGGAVLPRVADWLHNQDLRDNATMSGSQKLTVHTVAFGVTDATALKVLQATANLGGGIFQNASDPASLGNAVYNAINQVIPKEDSFSATAAASLQTMQTTTMHAFLTRFKPNQTPTWEGHLFETYLFDEHTAGCDTSNPTLQVTCRGKSVYADYNQDGTCTGVFQVDADCDEVIEDPATGDFIKKATRAPANVPWDAGQVLSDRTRTGYRSADETANNARNIFTWINGTKVMFTSTNAATLLPYMNVSLAWCNAFLTQLGITASSGQERLTCAQQIIHFVRGWDVLNQDGDSCYGPGNPKNLATCPSGTKGEERDRANDGSTSPIFWKLADVFHSSPAVSTAPITEGRCDTGYENQCHYVIHSPSVLPDQTPVDMYTVNAKQVDAYEAYRAANVSRERIILVGSNDGLLHGFDAGAPDLTNLDPTGMPAYQNGTGEELWAVIPPDMLPRLKDLVTAHQYMVDGSPMLSDVWVDGSGGSGAPDGRKQRDEFHTVAIFGRRSGGTVWTALDVTNPLSPTLLWNFPNSGCGDDARYMGQSWAEFAPRPPPIGPVRIASTTDTRGFEERWVVMINGGYDPMMTQGRAVFMLDAWTGSTLWRYTDADFKAQMAYGTNVSMFPVPGAVVMADVGLATAGRVVDGFWDTGVWGDLGGNLFVGRFLEPGRIDPLTGRVGNWYAARAFEQRRQTDNSQHATNRSEFFFMPDVAWDPGSKTLRALLGSGNRERIMAQSSTCGTDNLMGCCQAGCTNVTATSLQNFGTCNQTTTFSCANDVFSYNTSTTASCGTTTATCSAASSGTYNSRQNIHWECPGVGVQADASGTATWDGSGLATIVPISERDIKNTGSFRAQVQSRFYGVWVYGGRKVFDSAATARAFDAGRFTDVTYAQVCLGPQNGTCTLVNTSAAHLTQNASVVSFACQGGGTACQATGNDPGWFYEYGDYCPLGSCSPAPPWTDEKTGAPAVVIQSCAAFSSFRPVGSTTSTDPCSGSLGVPAAYDYALNWVSGAPDPSICGTIVAAVSRAITSPPSGGIVRVDVLTGSTSSSSPAPTPSSNPDAAPDENAGCAGGGIVRGITRVDAGSSATNQRVGVTSCVVEPLYNLDVAPEEHACRHVSSATCR